MASRGHYRSFADRDAHFWTDCRQRQRSLFKLQLLNLLLVTKRSGLITPFRPAVKPSPYSPDIEAFLYYCTCLRLIILGTKVVKVSFKENAFVNRNPCNLNSFFFYSFYTMHMRTRKCILLFTCFYFVSSSQL